MLLVANLANTKLCKFSFVKLLKPWHMGTHGTTQRELFNEYQHDSFRKSLHPCALDESSLSIGRVKRYANIFLKIN